MISTALLFLWFFIIFCELVGQVFEQLVFFDSCLVVSFGFGDIRLDLLSFHITRGVLALLSVLADDVFHHLVEIIGILLS